MHKYNIGIYNYDNKITFNNEGWLKQGTSNHSIWEPWIAWNFCRELYMNSNAVNSITDGETNVRAYIGMIHTYY